MKIGIFAATIQGARIGFPTAAFAGLAQDDDGDGVPNVLDECSSDSRNTGIGACDSDQDGYGNVRDGDFNQSGTTNSFDFTMFMVPQLQKGKPGPSGLACAGTIPCN